MRKAILASAVAALVVSGCANAKGASFPITVIVNPVASTGVTCAPSSAFTLSGSTFTSTGSGPVAAGTVVCTITVAPAGWVGTLSLTGANASSFAIAIGTTSTLNVGSAALAAGSYAVTINSAP